MLGVPGANAATLTPSRVAPIRFAAIAAIIGEAPPPSPPEPYGGLMPPLGGKLDLDDVIDGAPRATELWTEGAAKDA